jgi:hypothetical protein
MKNWCYFVLFIGIVGCVATQDAHTRPAFKETAWSYIHGQFIDRNTEGGIPGVIITSLGEKYQASVKSNLTGYYVLPLPPCLCHDLEFSHPAYEDLCVRVHVATNDTLHIDYFMNKRTIQYGIIVGSISDVLTGECIPGADVEILDTEFRIGTDWRGRFVFNNIPVGTYRIYASYISYTPVVSKEITVRANQATIVDIKFNPSGNM